MPVLPVMQEAIARYIEQVPFAVAPDGPLFPLAVAASR